jgi:hypothetical protein
MLQIVIHDDHVITPGEVHPGHNGAVLSSVFPEMYASDLLMLSGHTFDGSPGMVRAAIVYKDYFVFEAR